MWHEARKQEKKIRGMMVDYKRRAERRRDYYERIKQDPAQFLQVHGRPAKIHLDPAVATAADSPATMMPWQGSPNNMIDRFDVRAHLDIIPDYTSPAEVPKLSGEEDRKACYERYRTLVQNDFVGVNEDKFLHQIYLEERFGPVLKPACEDEKKKLVDKKAAIGYVYEDSTSPDVAMLGNPILKSIDDEEEDEDEKDDLSDIDLDITVDVSELSLVQCAEMNEHSHKYGMVDDDFITYLLQDKEEADQLRLVKEIEEEKAMFSGRKSRRERRALREKKLAGRKITSPPSYAARESPTHLPMRHSTSKSRSRSRTPPNSGKITFITSFGGEVSDVDHHEKKPASQRASKDASHKKSSKESQSSKGSSDIVIGPQLPEKSENTERKSRHRSSCKRSHSSSSSGGSSRRDRGSKRDGKKYSSSSKYRSGRSRRSSSSLSSSSRSRSRNKKKHSKRHSRAHPSSRSRSVTSRSRSRSSPRTRKHSAGSRSRSRSIRKSASPNLPPPPVKSYYRHSLSRSASELSDSDSPERREDSSSGLNTGISLTTKMQQLTGKAGPTTKSKLTPQERLKRKVQLALNKQYKADKRAQMEKTEKQLQERMDRAEELREMAIKLRQRERERRHRLRGYDRDSDSDSSLLREDYGKHELDLYLEAKERRAHSHSSDSSSSPDRVYSKGDDGKRFSENDSRSASYHSTPKSPPRDHRRSSSGNQPSGYKKSDSRWSPRRSPPRHSPCRSPSRSSRQRSPHKSSTAARYSDSFRQSSRSPYRHSSQQSSNRRERRSRSPFRGQQSRSRRSLVDY